MIAANAALGTMFGKYRLNARLGRGGMADVYLAEDPADQRLVALRIIEIRDDVESCELLEAERRGARLQERFCAVDSHVPRVYEHGVADGCFYVAMEFVDGEDLSEMLARGPLRAEVAAEVTAQICRCLASAHAFEVDLDGEAMATIVHGDITPKNVRLDTTGEVKLLDFGIAKALSLTRKLTRNAFGNFPYLSPERLDSGDVDAHADLWSVGVVFYEMLSGARPYRAENTRKLEKLILSKQPPAPLPDTCPEALRRVVSKLLHPELPRRYQTAAAIVSDLEGWTEGRQTTAEREWLAELTADEATRRTRPPMDALEDESTRRTSERGETGPQTAPKPAVPIETPASRARIRPVLRVIGWMFVLVLALHELRISRRADDVLRGLVTADATELDAAYGDYQRLADASLFRIGLGKLRARLKVQLVAEAERVIADFRREVPTVGKQQWANAQGWLGRALTLDPSDRSVEAALRYCEAHIQRLNGEERLQRRARPATNDNLRQAVQRFEEAAGLNAGWPDPYLGLVRVYLADLEDLDRAVEALREAERRGYRSGHRESAQFGDAYRSRGDRLRRSAATVAGLPQQREYLARAAESYRRALELYLDAPEFADVAENARVTQQRLTIVEAQLDTMNEPGSVTPLSAKPSAESPPWR